MTGRQPLAGSVIRLCYTLVRSVGHLKEQGKLGAETDGCGAAAGDGLRCSAAVPRQMRRAASGGAELGALLPPAPRQCRQGERSPQLAKRPSPASTSLRFSADFEARRSMPWASCTTDRGQQGGWAATQRQWNASSRSSLLSTHTGKQQHAAGRWQARAGGRQAAGRRTSRSRFTVSSWAILRRSAL